MVLTESQAQRYDSLVKRLLSFTNALYSSCIYFELPIDSEQKIAEALRISLDLWESPEPINCFIESFHNSLDPDTLEAACALRHSLRGPFYVFEHEGYMAHLYYEGTVFEAHSSTRTWSDMLSYCPDMIYTTLHPFEGKVMTGLFVLHHTSEIYGPGVQRLKREYEAALEKGIVSEAGQFIEIADRLNEQRRQGQLEINSAIVYEDYIHQINELTNRTCFPYELPECEIPAALKT